MNEAGPSSSSTSSRTSPESVDDLRTDAGKDAVIEVLAKVGKKPRGLKWRTSSWYITTVVAVGVATDCLSYNIVVPVLPYRLESLQYHNISALTSWLLFAYSAGILISDPSSVTFPVAYFFDKYPWRREPLVVAVLVLEGALVLFMLATPFWVMVIARFLMGAASKVVWSVGFALICENVEEKNIGRQIGFALAGVSVGTTIAPPIGGALYFKLGWKSPFIFTIIICAVDLVARLLVIEQKDLAKWQEKAVEQLETQDEAHLTAPSQVTITDQEAVSSTKMPKITDEEAPEESVENQHVAHRVQDRPRKHLSPVGVLLALVRSPRGMAGFLMTFVFGFVIGTLDPTLTLRVQSVWHKKSDFVGLIYLIASAPTFVTGPIVGDLADRLGSEWIVAPCLLLALPWIPLLILKTSLAGFVIFFALTNVLLSCALGPIGLEVAMAARAVEGMSEIHQFAAMNIAFSVSSAVGAVAGGQLYNSLPSGWSAVIWLTFGVCAIAVPVPLAFSGTRPLLSRLHGRAKGKGSGNQRSAERSEAVS